VPTRPMPPTSTAPRLPERTATIRSAARGSMVTTYLPHLRKASSTSLRTRISMLLVLGGIGNVVLPGLPALSTTTETYLAVTIACGILSAVRAGIERIGPRMNRTANLRSFLGIAHSSRRGTKWFRELALHNFRRRNSQQIQRTNQLLPHVSRRGEKKLLTSFVCFRQNVVLVIEVIERLRQLKSIFREVRRFRGRDTLLDDQRKLRGAQPQLPNIVVTRREII